MFSFTLMMEAPATLSVGLQTKYLGTFAGRSIDVAVTSPKFSRRA
jgi:hypothetical protein